MFELGYRYLVKLLPQTKTVVELVVSTSAVEQLYISDLWKSLLVLQGRAVRDYSVQTYTSFSEIQLLMVKGKMFLNFESYLNCNWWICIICLLDCILKAVSLISIRSANNEYVSSIDDKIVPSQMVKFLLWSHLYS